jgi:preprotein translocase subunit SecD
MAVRRGQALVLITVIVGLVVLAAYGIVSVLDRSVDVPDSALTVEAARPDGTAPDAADLERARTVLLARMRAANLEQPRVDRQGDRRLVLRSRGGGQTLLKQLVGPGQLRFRRVLATTVTEGEVPAPAAARPAVADKLGAAYTAAEAAVTVAQGKALPENVQAAFAALSPAEVATLPARMQLLIPGVPCEQLQRQGPVLCDRDNTKYLLDPAALTGDDVADAAAGGAPDGSWLVSVHFKADRQAKLTELTRQLAPNKEQLAIALDGLVVSAPAIQSVITGDVVISGNFSQYAAEILGAQLAGGELPVRLTPTS